MIKVGDNIPPASVVILSPQGLETIDFAAYIAGKKVVIFAVPGAFTPTCSQKHLPSYVENAERIKAMGIDEIICVAVNDPFVMKAWGEQAQADGIVTMLPDGNAAFTRAVGMEADDSAYGMAIRSRRYSMVVDKGIVIELQ
ncbi:MAG: peroxiredoxin, partial [Alphaproteobacteria bacterium]|nr:peroxiredoxin [Alphaproteobacteria bacterium]